MDKKKTKTTKKKQTIPDNKLEKYNFVFCTSVICLILKKKKKKKKKKISKVTFLNNEFKVMLLSHLQIPTQLQSMVNSLYSEFITGKFIESD